MLIIGQPNCWSYFYFIFCQGDWKLPATLEFYQNGVFCFFRLISKIKRLKNNNRIQLHWPRMFMIIVILCLEFKPCMELGIFFFYLFKIWCASFDPTQIWNRLRMLIYFSLFCWRRPSLTGWTSFGYIYNKGRGHIYYLKEAVKDRRGNWVFFSGSKSK